MFFRRKYPRVAKDYDLSYATVDDRQFQESPAAALAVNVSGGGLCFQADEALEKGKLVALNMGADDLRSPILALASVKWCKKKGDHYDVGAEFWWVGWADSDAQSTMADLIASKVVEPPESTDPQPQE
jgi:hypothetical protein